MSSSETTVSESGVWVPPLHVVLHEPEIPNNTGTIGRTCVALGLALHLVHPLAFDINEKARRRAGLDYWDRLRLHEYASTDCYRNTHRNTRKWLFTTHGTMPWHEADYLPGDHLVFGSETRGLPAEWVRAETNCTLALPMRPGERSLNLANAATAAAYEAVRQLTLRGDLRLDRDLNIIRSDCSGLCATDIDAPPLSSQKDELSRGAVV